jgi:hypothetical protein
LQTILKWEWASKIDPPWVWKWASEIGSHALLVQVYRAWLSSNPLSDISLPIHTIPVQFTLERMDSTWDNWPQFISKLTTKSVLKVQEGRKNLNPFVPELRESHFFDAHFQHLSWISPVDSIIILDLSYKSTRHRPISKNKAQSGPPFWVARFGNFQSWLHYLSEFRLSENLKSDEDGNELSRFQ